MVMAGFLLTDEQTELRFAEPMCVAKSHPDFWQHARMLGWRVEPYGGKKRKKGCRQPCRHIFPLLIF